ncbi:hypothetical protein ACFX2I_025675 [Malus domestica]
MRDLLSFIHHVSACPHSQAASSNFPSTHALDAAHATVPCTATRIAFKRIIRKRSKDQFSGNPYNIQQIYIQHSVALAKSYRLRFDEHVQREIMNYRSLDHPNIIRSKEMDEHVQGEIKNHRSLKNPNIIRFSEVSDHKLFSFCILRG